MSAGRHSFKHNDAARLVRAVEAAGKKVSGVRLDRSGAVTVLIDDKPDAAASSELDGWLEKHGNADKAEGH
jgi:hypothetical protein